MASLRLPILYNTRPNNRMCTETGSNKSASINLPYSLCDFRVQTKTPLVCSAYKICQHIWTTRKRGLASMQEPPAQLTETQYTIDCRTQNYLCDFSRTANYQPSRSIIWWTCSASISCIQCKLIVPNPAVLTSIGSSPTRINIDQQRIMFIQEYSQKHRVNVTSIIDEMRTCSLASAAFSVSSPGE
jgi:hypothetical protein